MFLHASCVAIGEKAVLLSGPSGIGKSDLALRLINEGARLVADDQTLLHCKGGCLFASPPPTLAGLIEIRHIGVMKMAYSESVPAALLIDLTRLDESLERLPPMDSLLLLDHPVQRLRLPAFAPSTPAKIRAFLTYTLSDD